jgi:nucleotide-binding universal stress UspA family protein
MCQRILVLLDGSKQAESVLLLASKLARIYNAELTLLHVVAYPIEMYSGCHSTSFVHPEKPNEKLRERCLL